MNRLFVLIVVFLLLGCGLGFSLAQTFGDTSESVPQDWVTDNFYGLQDISGCEYRLVFTDIQGDWFLVKSANTGSMRPVIGINTSILCQKIESVDEVVVGDIIVFNVDGKDIVHRIIEKGLDSHGVFLITKGDNNMNDDLDDFGKIREEQLRGVVVGIFY